MKAKFYSSCNFFGSDKNWAIEKFKCLSLGLLLDNRSVLEHTLGIVVNIFWTKFSRAVLFKTWQCWLRDNLPNTWIVWVYNWPAVRMGEINAMSDIKNNEKLAKIQMYKPYLAEFLSFKFFVTIPWELNRFSHEHVRASWLYSTEHYHWLLVVYPLSN